MVMIGNYQLLRTLLDHDEPSRIPSFHLGYASQVLEQGLLEYSEPQDADVCLYIDNGPLPRQNTIDLTIDHVLGYTGHYRGVGPAETRSVPPNYVIDRENLPFEQRFVNASDIPAPARDAKDSQGRPKVLPIGSLPRPPMKVFPVSTLMGFWPRIHSMIFSLSMHIYPNH